MSRPNFLTTPLTRRALLTPVQLLFTIAAFLPLAAAQTAPSNTSLSISFVRGTSQCSSSQFFDTSNLVCTACPTGYIPTDDHLACQMCDKSSGFLYDTVSGFGTSMTWVGSSSVASGGTPPRLSCACPASSSATISATVLNAGSFAQRCVTCPATYTAGQSSSGQPACIPPGTHSHILSPQEQFANASSALGVSATYTAATTAAFPTSAVGLTPSVSSSYPLVSLLGPGAYNCFYGTNNREACNAVANMCVLQLYNPSHPACLMYNSLVSKLAPSSTSTAVSTTSSSTTSSRPATGPLPWLFYTGSTYLTATDVNLNFQMHGNAIDPSLAATEVQTISVLTLVLSTYAMNGTWLGYRNWTKQFQICGTDKAEARNWLNFGWEYRNACELNLDDVLLELGTGCSDTALYDLYLQTGSGTLYPVPVKISNYVPVVVPVNDPNQGAVRRFFYVDGAMGRPTGGAVQAVQYPTSMRLVFTLKSDPRNQIYPPQLFITYSARSMSVQPDVSDGAVFQVSYTNNPGLNNQFWYAWRITLIVIMCVLALPVFAWRVWVLTSRRNGAENADQDFLLSGLISLCDIGSAGLTAVLVFVSIYYLILYKLQNSVYYMMVSDGDLNNFLITVYLAIVGQTVGLLNMIWEQSKVDVFFLDWEKGRKVLSKEGTKEEPAPVNCWRMLFLANELNELQTERFSSPAFTLLMMVLILVGNSVIASGYITPYGDFLIYPNNVSSVILRWGTEASFFAVLYMGQLLLVRFAYYRWVSHPVTSFIDLAFLCNISVIILDERRSGYYIHGRNQAQHSDTNLPELNQALLREEEGLVGERGLVVNNQGPNAERLNQSQVFNIFITEEIRKTYESKMLRQVAQAVESARMRKGLLSSMLTGNGNTARSNLSAQQEIASTFKHMVDDVERNSATRVIDPTYFHMLSRFPPEAARTSTVFVHDYFHSFTSTLFLGNDLRLFVYEALFFCTIDCLALNNVAISAFITYFMHVVMAWFRSRMGEDNLSAKTLVDRHFLI